MNAIQAILRGIGSIFSAMLDLLFNGSRSLATPTLDPHWEHEQLLKRLEDDDDAEGAEISTVTDMTSEHLPGTDDPYFESNSSNR